MFKQLMGDSVCLLQGGVYKVCDLYIWDGGLYAKYGGGFIRLRSDGTTSKQGVVIKHLETMVQLYADRFSRLTTISTNDTRKLSLPNFKDGL